MKTFHALIQSFIILSISLFNFQNHYFKSHIYNNMYTDN